MGGLGHSYLSDPALYLMVFKIFQKLPLSPISFILQLSYMAFLSALVFVLELNKISFFAGLVFSYLYMGLFFYSIKLIFIQKKRAFGIFLLFSKWLLLLFVLILTAWFLDGKSFLLALTVLLVSLLCFILEKVKVL